MKKVISKGYTVSVTSWENDGDNYKTKSMVIESEDETKAVVEMCKTIFKSCNNGDGGIGNMCEGGEEGAKLIIVDFMIKHPILIDKSFLEENSELKNLINLKDEEAIEEAIEDLDDSILEELVDTCMHYNNQLMGGSEYYYSRVCEKVDVTYSDIDVFSQEVNF